MYLDRLRDEIEKGRAIVVLGTGVTKALSNGDPVADWAGLLRTGLTLVRESQEDSAEGVALQEMALDLAIKKGDSQALLGVASWVRASLETISPQFYADWLRDTVGSLSPCSDDSLAHSIRSLGLPMATTNYDTLVEKVLGLKTTEWTDPETVRQALRGVGGDTVAHFHGVWTKPNTVILSELDYGKIVADSRAVANLSSFYHSHSFIFIGYGKGLEDPNFGMMLKHHREIARESRGDHFRLCLEGEVEDLKKLHLHDDIRVIPYGSAHGDLSGFLNSISPESRAKGKVLEDRVSFAVDQLRQQLLADVLHKSSDGVDDGAPLAKYLVPPVILSAPHERFVQEEEVNNEVAPEVESRRLDPTQVAQEDNLVILSGRELSGVSTTIRWLLNEAVLARPHTGPIYVDFNSLSPGARPLDRAIRREALKARLIDGINDELPDFVLAVDNVRPKNDKTYEYFIGELKETRAQFVILGSRETDGAEVLESLSNAEIEAQPLYIGRFGLSEVTTLAGLIVPGSSPTVCGRVLEIVRNEHLQRSPFTITLLLVLVAKESINLANSSETSVLDAYATYLLGRTGPFLDPRWTLGVQNRETILSEIAKLFVQKRTGSLPAPDVENEILGIFQRLDWEDDAHTTLTVFCQLRLLSRQNSQIKFQQSSYLHLFAAKAAMRDEIFRNELLGDPLFYAPIIRHYAALTRNSTQVLESAEQLVNGFTEPLGGSRIFTPTELVEYDDGVSLVDNSTESVSETVNPDDSHIAAPPTGDSATGSAFESDTQPPLNTAADPMPNSLAYDPSPDDDRLAFPLSDPSTWREASRLAWTLDLASRALRDSDDIQDLDTKDRLFRSIIQRWGYLLKRFEVDQIFSEGASALAESEELRDEEFEHFKQYVELLLPSLLVFSGISACLASTKLEKANQRAVINPAVESDPYALFGSAMFAYASRSKSWVSQWSDLSAKFGSLWIVNTFMMAVGITAFKYEVITEAEAEGLRSFFANCISARGSFSSEDARLRHIAKFNQNLTKMRALSERKRLPLGQRALN